MTIREIDEQIKYLQNERYKLHKQEIEDFKKNAEKNIGRCFKASNGRYVKVIGVPQERHTMTDIDINMYQYPALFLTDGILPFEVNTLYSGTWEFKSDNFNGPYDEITKEEFNEVFEKKLEAFKRNVISC